MIQDSINQALGALGQLGAVGKYFKNQSKAMNLEQVKAGTDTYKAQAQAKFNTEDDIAKLSELQKGIDTSTPEGAAKWKELEENKVVRGMHLGDINASQKDLEGKIAKKAGMKPIMRYGQQVGWDDGSKGLPSTEASMAYGAFRDVQAADAARQNALYRAAVAAETKQDQANNNFITIMGQNVRRDDPKYANIVKYAEKAEKENK